MDVKKDRFEYKYQVPATALSDLRQALAPFVDLDRYARKDSGDYTVRSIYFDTCALDYYQEKMTGLKIRKKLRVRGYNQRQIDSPTFIEIKRKNNMAISKNRAWVPYRHLENLFAGGDIERYVGPHAADPRDLEDAQRFFYHVYRYSLRPVVLIHYEREAFFRKFDPSVRITFDKNLRSNSFPALEDLFVENSAVPSLSGFFILEAKFYLGLPSWFKAILENFGLEREAISKYCICLDEHGVPRESSRESILSSSQPCHFPCGDVPRDTFPVRRANGQGNNPRTGRAGSAPLQDQPVRQRGPGSRHAGLRPVVPSVRH